MLVKKNPVIKERFNSSLKDDFMSIRLVKGRIDLVIKSEVEIKQIYGW